jgi:hypothetical protein
MRAGRLGVALGLGAALVVGEARADLKMTVVSTLGVGATNNGWMSYAVRVESTEKGPIQGRVVARSEAHKSSTVSEAPVTVLPGAAVVVRMPVRLENSWNLAFELQDGQGKALLHESISLAGRHEPLLVDLNTPSRVVGPLQSTGIPAVFDREPGRGKAGLQLQVGPAVSDATSGDLLLPQRAAEWAPATAVLAPSDVLARLGGPELEALTGYVLGGGTLAVVIKRPEDLRQGPLPVLLGGVIEQTSAPAHLRRFFVELRKPSGGKSPGQTVQPSREVADGLVAYSGGNLRPSDLGSSAPYGLGEVHLLPFDPGRAPDVDDPWVHGVLLEMVRHAWDRTAFLAAPQGGAFLREGEKELRGQLDPNEGTRWTIVLSTLLLLGYAIVAGPVNFLLSARAHRPLRALLLLPLLSGLTFVAIVALAVFAKGWQGEARRFSLIEVAGGMNKGVIRRYRGLFTPVAQQATVQASSDQALLSAPGVEQGVPVLRVERGGIELRDVNVLPWKSLILREDDLVSLQGGVSLTPEQGDIRITNRLGRGLRGLVIHVPGRGLYRLPSLADGASSLALSGELLASGSLPFSGPRHAFSLNLFGPRLEQDSKGLSAAWSAIHEVTRGRMVDWWPEEVPILLAQVEGGEGVVVDQGLKVTRDRSLLRVVGFGGAP